MLTTWKKAALAAGFLTLAPIVPLISGSGSDVYAHTNVSGSVVIGSPVAVFGFSYGDPFAVAHVHYAPVHCSVGPLYYYPAHRVYGHYHPRYSYQRYAAPVYYRPYPGYRTVPHQYGPHQYGRPHHGPPPGQYRRVRGHGYYRH